MIGIRDDTMSMSVMGGSFEFPHVSCCLFSVVPFVNNTPLNHVVNAESYDDDDDVGDVCYQFHKGY